MKSFKQIIADTVPENWIKRAMIFRHRTARSTIEAFRKGKRYLSFLVDINNVCNLNCIMCSRGIKGKPLVDNMTKEEFKAFADKCLRNARALQISCAFELSIAKHAPAILRLLPEYSVPITSIYTNFNILTDQLLEAIFDGKLTKVVVSIGEATEETYSKIRRPGKLTSVLKNIQKFHGYRKERHEKGPALWANLTIMKSNIYELPDFIDLARDMGLEGIVGRHLMLFDGLDMEQEMLTGQTDSVNESIRLARKKADAYNIKFEVPFLKAKPKIAGNVCTYPWDTVYVSSNGDISICPRIKEKVILGNIFEKEFIDIYYRSEEIKKLRTGNLKKHNEICDWCLSDLKEREPIDQGF